VRLDRAVKILRDAGRSVELFATPGPNRAGELACAAVDAGCDLILASGGDGTINEAVNGIAGSNATFGVLPGGTANVLANEIGLATRPDHAAKQLLHATPVRIALGALERPGRPRRYFVLMAGVGLDARIVYNVDPDLKNRLGKLAYWHGGFSQFGRPIPLFRASVNGAEYCASFVLITRVRNYGGDFEIARQVRLTDNDFEVVLFRNNRFPDFIRFLGGVITNRLASTDGVVIARATHVAVAMQNDERVHIQTDGESMGLLPATISIVPDALTLLIPRRYAGL
jgi:YegS/Rv2252/BmrU family lipid kinase